MGKKKQAESYVDFWKEIIDSSNFINYNSMWKHL